MRILLISAFLFLCFFQGMGQTPFSKKVWSRFYELVQLPVDEQVLGFRKLQQESIQNKAISDSTYTNLLFLYATAQFQNNQMDSAIDLIKESIQISQKNPSKNPIPYLAKYYFYLAYYQSQIPDFESAIKNYHIAYELGIKQYNKWSIPSLACQQLAHLYYEIGDYELGLKYASWGAKMDVKNQNYPQLINNLYEQCLNMHAMDLNDRVEPSLDSLMSLAEFYADDYKKGLFYTLIGKVETSKKNYDQAETAFLTANKFFLKSNSEDYIQMNYVALQYVSLLQKAYKKSLKYEQLANANLKVPFTKSVLYSNRAFYFKEMGDHANALKSLQQALQALPFQNDHPFRNGNPSAYQLKNLPQKEYAFTALYEKAEIQSLNKSSWKQALQTYQILDTLVDLMRWQHQDIGSKLFWRNKLMSLYGNAITISYNLNQVELAFYFIEKSKAALLVDQLNRNAANIKLPPEEALKESALRLQVVRNQYATNYQERNQYLQAKAKLDDFVLYLEKKYPTYFDYKYNYEVPTLKVLQKNFAKSKQSLITYFEGEEHVYVFSLNSKTHSLKTIPAHEFQREKKKLFTLLSNPNWTNSDLEEYLKCSNQLYQQILKPVEDLLTKRIIVSTSGELIPFAALSKSGNKAEYLINDHAFSYTYSTRTWLIRNKKTITDKADEVYFLGMAPVDFRYNHNLLTLIGSQRAIQKNANLFHSKLAFTNEEANFANFERYWQKAKVVQVISHAYAGLQNEEPSIFLADKALYVSDLYQQTVNTQLLVLSACRTSDGREYRGEGVFSLSRGFFASGVHSMLSTLWDIVDQDAYQLSNRFLSVAKNDIPLDLALQQTQKAWLLNADRNKQLPHAWAGIILIGSSDALAPEESSTKWILFTVSLLFLAILGYLLYRKTK